MASTIELLLLAQATQWQAAWTSYNVSWTSSGTAPVVGSGGTLFGSYLKIGRLVTAKIALTAGSATTFGTGAYNFTLPFTAAVTGVGSGGFAHVGAWGMYNAGNVTFYGGTAIITQGSPAQVSGLVNGSATFMGATNPVSLSGSGSQLTCTITYESAS